MERRGRVVILAVHCQLQRDNEGRTARRAEWWRIDREGVLEHRSLKTKEVRDTFAPFGPEDQMRMRIRRAVKVVWRLNLHKHSGALASSLGTTRDHFRQLARFSTYHRRPRIVIGAGVLILRQVRNTICLVCHRRRDERRRHVRALTIRRIRGTIMHGARRTVIWWELVVGLQKGFRGNVPSRAACWGF